MPPRSLRNWLRRRRNAVVLNLNQVMRFFLPICFYIFSREVAGKADGGGKTAFPQLDPAAPNQIDLQHASSRSSCGKPRNAILAAWTHLMSSDRAFLFSSPFSIPSLLPLHPSPTITPLIANLLQHPLPFSSLVSIRWTLSIFPPVRKSRSRRKRWDICDVCSS